MPSISCRNPGRDRHGRPAVHRAARESPVVQGRRTLAPASAPPARRSRTPQRGGCPIVCPTTSPRPRRRSGGARHRAEAGLLRPRLVGRRGNRSASSRKAGHIVVSNSRNYRMFDTVPLLIPEVNGDHLKLLDAQGAAHGWKRPHRDQPELRDDRAGDGARAAPPVRAADRR